MQLIAHVKLDSPSVSANLSRRTTGVQACQPPLNPPVTPAVPEPQQVIRYGRLMQTATEFAAGRGHPQYPLLSPRQSPSSRVACTDFSPWLRARLAEGDTDAAILYVLQIIQANPGVGVAVDFETQEMSRITAGAETWMRTWTREVRDVIDVPFSGLQGSTPGWELDLRTILVMMRPLQDPLSVLTMGAEEGREGNSTTIAAAMVCHDVRLNSPENAARTANAKLREWRTKLAPVEWISEATVADVTPPPPTAIPYVLQELPLATRSHLVDIGLRPNRGPAFASKFSTYYRTRQIGCDEEQSLFELIRHGLIRVVDDQDAVWQASAQALTIAQLKELLANAGIHAPTRAKKAEIVAATRPISTHVIAATADQGPVCELTSDGERTIGWVKSRVKETRGMWGVWAAYHQRDLFPH